MFDLDTLPVNFGSVRLQGSSRNGESSVNTDAFPRSEINAAMRDLNEVIWREGGFRFKHTATHGDSLTYQYRCSQDQAHAKCDQFKREVEKRRDGRRMTRFSCKSKLNMRPDFQNRTLSISIHHEWHSPYEDVELSPEVREFIHLGVSTKTPSEIYREIRGIPGASTVTRHQVYYLWQKANAEIWQRDSDPLKSATMLLSENGYQDHHTLLTAGNLRALGFYAPETIQRLDNPAVQLLMDSTFGTNGGGLALFAVLAEVEGTGVPLGYCLVEPPHCGVGEEKAYADPGATTSILQQFLERLKGFGLNPRCFATDKDQTEISAVTTVWPGAKLQLCYWHVKRAISMKLNSSKSTKTQDHYYPEEARKIIPNLEICWGSLPVRRPTDHRFGRCQCQSKNQEIREKGRLEPASKDEHDTVLDIFCRHFNVHPLIPDSNGTFKSSEAIHRECAAEMYTWCKARGYYRLWAYLYTNWYCPKQWERWARAADPAEIPVVKTTMIVESHWRTLKHDYLHRFNRPRVDLVVWILISRVIPDAVHRMEAILKGQFRVFKARWREAFKKQWKREASKTVDAEKLKEYHTNPVKWVCACKSFLQSRFLLCKHIVHCFESPSREFFDTVRRQTSYPFWKDERLVLRPEFRLEEQWDGRDLEDDAEESASDSSSESELDYDGPDADVDRDSDEENETIEERIVKFKNIMGDAMVILEEQAAKGNTRFVEKFMSSSQSICTLVDEVHSLQNRRSMPATWGRYRHPATMYLR
jgi:MULE transposase domain